MKKGTLLITLSLLITSFQLVSADSTAAEKPQRIVSLNLCADQLLLMLATPEQISALTHLSHEKSASIHYQQALNHPTTRAQAEEILPFKPDLVITGQYANPATSNLLKKLGLRLETLPIANNLDTVISNIRHIAQLTGNTQHGEQLIDDMEQRLKQLTSTTEQAPLAAVYDANGYTVGADSLRGQMLKLAGWRNAGEELGIRSYGELSLEAIVQLAPDALIDSPYSTAYSRAQALAHHPALRDSKIKPHIIHIPSQYTICGGPWTINVIEQLHNERQKLEQNRLSVVEH